MKIRTILISQPKPESEKSPYFDIIRNQKVQIDFNPFIHVEGVPAADFRKQKIDLADFRCIVLNSKNAVDHYFRMANEMRYTVPEGNKYFCLTEAIALYLQKYIVYRKRKIFFAQQGIQELIEPFRKNKQEKFLFPSSDKHSDKVTEFFNQNNIAYTQGVFFRTVSSDMSGVDVKGYDMLVFFTPAGIHSLFENFPGFEQGDTRIAIFGTATLAAAETKGLRIDLAAPLPQAPSMAMAIDLFLKEYNGKNGGANLSQFGPVNIKRTEPVVVPEKKPLREKAKAKKKVKRKAAPKKKAAAPKAPAKKAAPAKPAKKAAVKKAEPKKAAAKKPATKKATPKKPAKKSPPKPVKKAAVKAKKAPAKTKAKAKPSAKAKPVSKPKPKAKAKPKVKAAVKAKSKGKPAKSVKPASKRSKS